MACKLALSISLSLSRSPLLHYPPLSLLYAYVRVCVFSTSLQLVLFRTSSPLLSSSLHHVSLTDDDDGVRCGGGERGKD